MVFCVIFVFATLVQFAILLFLQKQIFGARIQKAYSSLADRTGHSRTGSKHGNRLSRSSSVRTQEQTLSGAGLINDPRGYNSTESGLEMSVSAGVPLQAISHCSTHRNSLNEKISMRMIADGNCGASPIEVPEKKVGM